MLYQGINFVFRYIWHGRHVPRIRALLIVRTESAKMEVSAQLYNAVADNNVDLLRTLLENGADPNELYEDMQNISSMNILHICANKGRIECAKLLVDAGAEVITRDQWGMTPVAYSVISNHPPVTDFLLSRCPRAANSFDKFGKSAIHTAIEYDRLESLEILLKHSADVNIGTMQGITPLMCLCGSKNVSNKERMMTMLIEAGTVIDNKDLGTKRTALQVKKIVNVFCLPS